VINGPKAVCLIVAILVVDITDFTVQAIADLVIIVIFKSYSVANINIIGQLGRSVGNIILIDSIGIVAER